jgi:hypothetical protein
MINGGNPNQAVSTTENNHKQVVAIVVFAQDVHE